jgi:macrolide phosphotransferase
LEKRQGEEHEIHVDFHRKILCDVGSLCQHDQSAQGLLRNSSHDVWGDFFMSDALNQEVMSLAARHGLDLREPLEFNEQGLDFRIVFAEDGQGIPWVLRIPRRADVFPKVVYEEKVLAFVKRRLSVKVPDWRVANSEVVAYPRLTDKTALSFDPTTYEVHWNIDQNSDLFIESLARSLAELHQSPVTEAVAAGITQLSSEAVRKKFRADWERVKAEIGLGQELETFCHNWLNDDSRWPDFTGLIHGDLYAGHVTVDAKSRVSGIIDWTEAHIGDTSSDFAGHLAAFNEESLGKLIVAYEKAGGRTWPKFFEQIKARHFTAPIRYGVFALESQNPDHMAAAKAQLGAD